MAKKEEVFRITPKGFCVFALGEEQGAEFYDKLCIKLMRSENENAIVFEEGHLHFVKLEKGE